MRNLLLIITLLTFTPAYGSSPFPLAYFNEVALSSEYEDPESLAKVRMWTEDIKVYVHGNGSLKLNNELDNVIKQLNGLTSTIDISKVTSKEQANFEVYFGSADDWSKTEPVATGWASNAKKHLAKNHGLFYCSKRGHAITKCTIYVDTERASSNGQLHLLREEFTQGLGLMNDSPAYPDSIFYSKESYTIQYSRTDIELIEFLYSGLVVPKMNGIDIRSLLLGITPFGALTSRDGLAYRKNFPDLPFTGEARKHFQNNRVSDQQNYQKGKLHGTQRKYYESGQLKADINYSQGSLHGLVLNYTAKGNKIGKWEYKNGVKHGLVESFYESEQLKSSVEWIAGKKDGTTKTYYESGQLKSSTDIRAGKKEGQSLSYYESGQLQLDYNYSQDLLEGVILSYTIEGNKKGKWEYKNGVKHGLEEIYHENGVLKARLNWETGVLVGQPESYDLNGNLISKP